MRDALVWFFLALFFLLERTRFRNLIPIPEKFSNLLLYFPADQQADTFDGVGPGEKIDRLNRNNRRGRTEPFEGAGQGGWIAGDIDKPFELDLGEGRQQGIVAAAAGRVDHSRSGVDRATGHSIRQPGFSLGDDKLDCLQAVLCRIDPGISNRWCDTLDTGHPDRLVVSLGV